ncbi:MAG: CPBP family intramembrane metalloprotease [Gemmatimonadetes bacterium]|nr:CPBP family intramembrane metalloprotease [Gemmatimonadota bacterium]
MEMTYHVLHAAYAVGLIWYLVRTGLSTQDLPEIEPIIFPKKRFGAWIPAMAVGLMFALVVVSDDGADLLLLLMMPASLWILVAWWRKIRLVWVLQGVVLGLVAFAAGIPARDNGLISETVLWVMPGFVPFMYVAGGLLLDRTGLSATQLRSAEPGKALKGFLWGCLLFLPMGFFNVVDGPVAGDLTWVTEWWMPLSAPWFSGIAEEAWFRLFLMGFCFFLLRPVFRTRPALAVAVTVVICGITFGLIHGRTMERFLTTGLLYGVPMATVFAKRDWEHAVGAHYIVNMPSWVMAFLGA